MIPLRTKLRTASLALVMAGLPWMAHAAALDADQIKRDLAAYLDQIGGTGKDRTLVYREVETKPEGDALRVAIDDLAVQAEASGPVPLGTVTFRLKGRDDGNYDIDDVTLPAELKLGEKDDVVTFKLPSVAVTGLWSPKLQTLLGLDASVKDISIADKKSVGSIAGIAAKLVTTDKGNGHYDEAGSFVLSGLKMSDTEKHSVSLGEIAVESSAQNVDVAAMAQQQEKLKALQKEGKAASEADLMAMLGGMFALLPNGKGTLKVTDLAASDGTEGWSFALPTASFGGALTGLDQDKGGIALELAYAGLTYSTGDQQADEMTGALAPRRLSLALGLEELPSKQLMALLGTYLQANAAAAAAGGKSTDASSGDASSGDAASGDAAGAPPMDPSMMAMMLLPQLQGALVQAGSKFRISPSEIESQAATIKLEGLAQATGQSAMGAVATLKLEITGLDKIIALAKQMAGPAGGDELKALDVLRLVSERSKAADGTPVDRYTFSLTPEGEMKVNDKPIDSLFQ
ncbi:MAG: hypothetical protein U1E53_19120 [Dongiaceae bacterium]